MVKRRKASIFVEAKETTTVLELKKIIEGIMKTLPENQRLWKDDQPMDDNKILGDYGFTSSTAKAQDPATVGLSFRGDEGEFEPLVITPLSTPPALPDVMKHPDSVSQSQEQTA
ncbi:PREDICTED: transcription elongation factor B polypeptide 2-like isoform X2 [Priapulus caudatus]|nr:PREDICTED: transcription elongation factor B polypeptide 2-like isoform X2 [Priapulus caudatus]